MADRISIPNRGSQNRTFQITNKLQSTIQFATPSSGFTADTTQIRLIGGGLSTDNIYTKKPSNGFIDAGGIVTVGGTRPYYEYDGGSIIYYIAYTIGYRGFVGWINIAYFGVSPFGSNPMEVGNGTYKASPVTLTSGAVIVNDFGPDSEGVEYEVTNVDGLRAFTTLDVTP